MWARIANSRYRVLIDSNYRYERDARTSGENCTSETLIKNLLSALKKYSLNGVGLFKAEVVTVLNQEKITSWKEQILDIAGNIIKIPCN